MTQPTRDRSRTFGVASLGLAVAAGVTVVIPGAHGVAMFFALLAMWAGGLALYRNLNGGAAKPWLICWGIGVGAAVMLVGVLISTSTAGETAAQAGQADGELSVRERAFLARLNAAGIDVSGPSGSDALTMGRSVCQSPATRTGLVEASRSRGLTEEQTEALIEASTAHLCPGKTFAPELDHVHDAATVVLTDGTRLRQVGIAAPEPGTCEAKQARDATEQELRLHDVSWEVVGQTDEHGNLWAYIQGGYDSEDLGETLAGQGWVYAYPESPAPLGYDQRIAGEIDYARSYGLGRFGSMCEPVGSTPAEDGPGSAPDLYVGGGGDDGDDGESRFCRRRWWC